MKPENLKKVEKNIQSGNSKITQGSRNVSNFLPSIFQTATNKKFLNSTLEHLFSSGTTESIDTYWGKINGSSFDYDKDVYNRETDSLRQNYQFAPGFKSEGETFDVTMSYINSIKNLGSGGYRIEDMDRLMADRDYILDLPIDHDMFVNYLNYHWIVDEIPVCDIEPTVDNPITIEDIVYLNSYTTPILQNGKSLTLVNGMRIRFIGDYSTSITGEFSANAIYFVEGIGTGKIKLIEQYNSDGKNVFPRAVPYTPNIYVDGWDTTSFDSIEYDDSNYINILKEYVVINRSSEDKNPWSRINKWYSNYAIYATAEYNDISYGSIVNEKTQARRPIIQFDPNIRMYNNGLKLAAIIDHHIDGVSINDIIGNQRYLNNGHYITDGDYILITDFDNSNDFNIYEVSGVETSIELTLITSQIIQNVYDKVYISNSNITDLVSNEFYYNSDNTLIRAYQKKHRSDSPLFALYSLDSTDLIMLPDTNFKGNPIFEYKISSSVVLDQESGLNLVTNSISPDQYIFNLAIQNSEYTYTSINGITKKIEGEYLFKIFDDLNSVWSPSSDVERSKVVEIAVIDRTDQKISNMIYPIEDTSEFIVEMTTDRIKWYEKKYGYIYSTGEKNPKIHIVKNKDYIINWISNISYNSLIITDPYGNVPSGVTIVNETNKITINVSDDYEYDTLLYSDLLNNNKGYIFLENIYKSYEITKNGNKLEENIGYTINNGFVQIIETLNIGDVIEFSYYSDSANKPRDIAPSFTYNPMNENVTELSLNEIFDHIINQNISNPYTNNSVFVGDNDYYKIPKITGYGGNIRQQLYSPASHTVITSGDAIDLMMSLDMVKNDYEGFKNIFKTKVNQLWKDGSFYTIRDLVDEALSQINIGKDDTFNYSKSGMAYYDNYKTYTYNVTDSSLSITLPFVEHINTKDQVWINLDGNVSGAWIPLKKEIDFFVDFDILTINPETLGSATSAIIEVRLYDKESRSYIPYSPVKLGFSKKHNVKLVNDTIVCHDGSIHSCISDNIFDIYSPSFDVVSAAVYDLETRIYNNTEDNTHSVFEFLSKFNNTEFLNYGLLNELMKEECFQWASYFSNGYLEERITPFDSVDKFTYNYKNVTSYESYKSLYKYLFNTDRPHTHPWEMLGYNDEPTWWSSKYSWTDPVLRANLLTSLKNGIVGETLTTIDPRYAYYHYDWDNNILVSETGELNDPITAGIVDPIQLGISTLHDDFEFGNSMYKIEEEWMNTSNYIFSLFKVLFKLKPYKMWNIFWIKGDINNVSGTSKDIQYYNSSSSRIGIRSNDLHLHKKQLKKVYDVVIPAVQQNYGVIYNVYAPMNEFYGQAIFSYKLNEDSTSIEKIKILDAGYGYRNEFPLIIETETGVHTTNLIAKVEETQVTPVYGINSIFIEQYSNIIDISELLNNTKNLPIIHMGGFTKSELIKLELDGSYNKGTVSIPFEDYGIKLIQSPANIKIRYSGLKVKKLSNGEFEVTGYNNTNRYFRIIPPNKNGSSIDIELNNSNSVTQYQKFHNRIEQIPYGTRFKKRQDLYNFIIGLEAYYSYIGFSNLNWKADALSIMKWSLLSNDFEITHANGMLNGILVYNNMLNGLVKDLSEYNDLYNPIVGELGDTIDPTNYIVYREGDSTGIKPKTVSNRIYGITLEIVEYEHVLYINQISKFGDIVQKPSTGIINSRIKIKGEKTKNWNGRLESPGFVITNDSIINNFDSTVREIENDILNSVNKSINTLSRKTDKFTVGYQESSYFMNISNDEYSAYEFHKGVRKYKGTKSSIDALLRNKNIFSKNKNNLLEEWMIFSKDYGDKNSNNTIQVEIPRDLVKTDPQIVRFNSNYRNDNIYDSIIDISNKSSQYISGNFDSPIPLLPSKPFAIKTINDVKYFQNFSKTSGIPLESEVDYITANVRDMLDVYEYSRDYANVPLWSSKVSYKKGDIVRRGPSVYQYLLNSTGYADTAGQIYIRGNVTFPKVAPGTTFELGIRQRGETSITQYVIPFVKTTGSTEYTPYEYIGSISNPTSDLQTYITLNGTQIIFNNATSAANVKTNETITAIGSLDSFSVLGEFLDQIIIDDYRIKLSNISTTDNTAISLYTGMSIVGIDLINIGIPQSISNELAMIPDLLNSFRTAYIQETSLTDWYNFISNYYSGIYTNTGFNINYLTNFYSSLTGIEPYFSEFDAFYQNEINIYFKLFGVIILSGETQILSPVLTNMVQLLQQTKYISNISRYIKSGGPINGGDYVNVLGTIGSSPLTSSEIVNKINSYLTSNGLDSVYDVSTYDNKLKIVKKLPLNTSGKLEIIVDATGTNLGFSDTVSVYNTIDEQPSTNYYVSLQNMVNTINSYGLLGIVASIHVVGQNNYLKITNNNPSFTIGEGTANTNIGLVQGVYNSELVEGSIPLELNVDDVVDQINAYGIANVTASNINNSVVISAVVAEIDVGNGTANSSLGFSDIGTIVLSGSEETNDTVINYFNSTEWTKIDDPINFSIWVNDNLDPIIVNTNRQSGYNVYQAMDFELEIFEICPGTFSNDDAMIKFLKPHNLRVNDYIVLTSTNSTPNVDGIHRVTAIYSDTIIFIESYIKNNGSYGKCLPLRPVRFSTTQQMLDSGYDPKYHFGSYGWKPGMIAYVDSYEGTGIPAAYRCVDVNLYGGVYFELIRKFEPLADNSKLISAYVYNYKTHEIKSELEVYDPLKGIIPGIAEIELDIKSIYDNARYTDSTDTTEVIDPNNYWADDKVGKTWWDMSNSTFLEYEQGSLEYRQQNWGKLFKTASIDVYEWTKSPVPPDEYDTAVKANTVINGIQLSGTPYYRIGQYGDKEYYWTEKTTFDRTRGISETYYYFWTKNKTTVPNNKRSYTTVDIENIIKNPTSYGISWIAAISSDSVLISNLDKCLACENAVLNIWFKNTDNSYHKEYILLSENETERKIPNDLHNSLRNSLAGYTDFDIKYDYSPWLEFKQYNVGDVVKYDNNYYISTRKNVGVIPQQTTSSIIDNTWNDFKFIDSIQNEDFWNVKKYGYVWDEDSWDTQDWAKPFPNNISDIDGELYIKSLVPTLDYTKHELRRYGISEKTQTWFKNLSDARREFILKLNSMLININMLEIQSLWYEEFNKIFHPSNKVFDTYYVDYKLSDMYTYADWKLPVYNTISKINYNINSILEIDSISPSSGDTVRVIDESGIDGIKRNKIYLYDGFSWNLIFQEKATIQFLDDIWNPMISSRDWSDNLWDISNWDTDTGPYFYRLLDILYSDIFQNQMKSLYNDLWFTMLKYVHSEQDFVRWAVKSSYFKFVLENDLSKSKFYKKDTIQDVIDYINDVKPFTSKLRDFTTRQLGNDSLTVSMQELGYTKDITLNYSNVSNQTVYNGDVVITNTFTQDQDITNITSSMDTDTYDVIYDGNGMDYGYEKFSDELIPSRINDAVGIFITRNENGSTETSTSKQYVIHVNNRNKIHYSISSNENVSQLTYNVSETDTSIEVDDGSVFLFNSSDTISRNKGVIWINGERIEYKNVIGNLLLNCVRGTGGTAPMTHTSGDNVLYTNGEYNDYPPIELSTIMYNSINYN